MLNSTEDSDGEKQHVRGKVFRRRDNSGTFTYDSPAVQRKDPELLFELSTQTPEKTEELYTQDEDENKENKDVDYYTQDDFEDLPDPTANANYIIWGLTKFHDLLSQISDRFGKIVRIVVYVLLLLGYLAYFIYANICNKKKEDDIRLIWLTGAVLLLASYSMLKRLLRKHNFYEKTESVRIFSQKHRKIIYGVLIASMGAFVIFCCVYLVAMKRPANFRSLGGVGAIVLCGVIFSKRPALIPWRLVLVGLWLQFTMGVIVLQTSGGQEVFKFLGARVKEFLDHTDAGSEFIFGQNYKDHFFAFKILPVIVYFSTATSILTHYGVLQVLVRKLGWAMQVTMGATACESMNTAANIFLGMTEAPLLIKPFVGRMTNSELHAIMTGGFATIAGTVFAAYISFGVPPDHLLAASVMSAPAAIALSKLFYPETKVSKTTVEDLREMDFKSPYENFLDAAVGGAVASVKMVSAIAATLLAFLAGLDFVNDTLEWFSYRACLKKPLKLQMIMAYLLWPLAFLMGIDKRDCLKVGELIGTKTFITEFIAFEQLGKLINNRLEFAKFGADFNKTVFDGDDIILTNGTANITLVGGYLQVRSEIICTYALCGFANVGSIGVMMGGMSAIAPHRKADMSRIVIRAMVTGTLTTILSACIAGLLSSS